MPEFTTYYAGLAAGEIDGPALDPRYSSPSAAAVLAALITVDGTGSGLDADLLDGKNSTAFVEKVAGGASVEDIGAVESNVFTNAATGSTETLDTSLYGVFDMTMNVGCTFSFTGAAPSGKATIFTMILRGAFTPVFPASVDWPDATAPTYTTPSVFTFLTVDGGTTWFGTSAGKAFG